MRLDLQNNPAFLGANRGTGLITSLRRIVSREKAPTAQQAADEAGVPVLNDDVATTIESLTPEQARQLEPYEDKLREGLTIEPIERTNLVYIHYRHNEPQIAMNVANTVAQVFIENDIGTESFGSDRALTMLGRQITELQEQIRADEAARIAYMGRHDIPLPKNDAANLTALQLTTYSQQMQAAEADRKEKEVAYRAAEAAMQRDDVLSIPSVQDNGGVRRIREKIEGLQSAREALLVQYTPEWPEVKKIDSQIKQLQAELNRIPTQVVGMMKTSYEQSVNKEDQLKRAYFTKRADATQQTKAEIGLSDLNQRIETNKQLYQTYLQRQRELQVTTSDRTNNVTQVEEARLPREPIGPPRVRNIMIALLLALAVGIGLAFLLDYLDDTLKSVEDVDRHLHLPTLALIPAPRESRRILGRAAPAPAPGDASTALALIEDVRSPVAEAYRHLRTSLLLSSAGQPPKTILVTSSQPSEGQDDDGRQHRHDARADRRRGARPRLRPQAPARPLALRDEQRARRDQLPVGRRAGERDHPDQQAPARQPEGHPLGADPAERGGAARLGRDAPAPLRCSRRTSRTSSSTRRPPSRSRTPRSSRRWWTA